MAAIAADFTAPVQAQSDDETSGRIVARQLANGRVEFGWQPAGGERILPRSRYFPSAPGHNRWLRSSPVEVDGVEIGRINARQAEDGRIEFAFTPTDGERIEPQSRYFPAGAQVGRWLRSTEITIPNDDSSGQATSPTESLDRQIAERFAPVLFFAHGEQYFPVPVELMIQHSTLHYTRNGQSRTKAPGTYRLTDLTSYNGRDSYLDLADEKRGATGERVVYARVTETYGAKGATSGVLITYWFFYLYNATGFSLVGADHEGDWEGVQLWFAGLDRDDLLTANVPTQLGYAAHGSGWAYTQNTESCAEINASIWPPVYVARNRHASYLVPGSGGHLDKSKGIDTISGIPSLRESSQAFGTRDEYQGDGATWVLQGRDLPNVGGELGYEIRMLPTVVSQSWLAWNGRWGDTSGQGGPIGPAFKPHFRFAPTTIAGWSQSQDEFTCRPSAYGEPATSSDDDERATGSADDERATSSDAADPPATDDGEDATDSANDERATDDSREFTAVSAGDEHTCGLHSTGGILCWGSDEYRQSDHQLGSFIAVSAGWDHNCAIRKSGEIECWGFHSQNRTNPPEGSFTTVSAGNDHNCAIRKSGEIECWGWKYGTDPPEGSFAAVSAGAAHTCGLGENGWIECWGSDNHNQSRNPAGWFTAVSAGGYHTCGLRESSALECWGRNDDGQSDAPAGSFTAVSAGGSHTCGLRENGAIECWGGNGYGQSDAPQGRYTAVSAGWDHTCGLRDTGAIECWGDNDEGQAESPTR